jgi:hypothetical protein
MYSKFCFHNKNEKQDCHKLKILVIRFLRVTFSSMEDVLTYHLILLKKINFLEDVPRSIMCKD